METINLKQTNETKKIKKEKKWGWILICFFIFTAFKNTKIDEAHLFTRVLLLLSLILAPFFYYWVKPKFINITKDYVIGLIVVFIFIFVISLLGGLSDAIILKAPSNQTTQERDAIIQKTNEAKVWFQDWQVRWENQKTSIVDVTILPSKYSNNISGYKELQKLNNEKYYKSMEVYDIVAKYLTIYSSYDMKNIYNFTEKQHNSYDELFNAKVEYFQTLLDNKPYIDIIAKESVVKQKTEIAMAVESEAQTVLAEYNKALVEILNK